LNFNVYRILNLSHQPLDEEVDIGDELILNTLLKKPSIKLRKLNAKVLM
jgi:hypothetical protein